MSRLRTALLFMAGNFVGPEYYAGLARAGRTPDLVCHVGQISGDSIAWERRRTGGFWNPPPLPASETVHAFASLKDPRLLELLLEEKVDVCIQAGVGILKGPMLQAPKIGWLNVHPGKLPEYRGNACPEWAVYNGDEVWATAHIIDEGIDTGPVVAAGLYDYDPNGGYHLFRAGIYRHCTHVLIEALNRLGSVAAENVLTILTAQDHARGVYRPKISDEALAAVIAKLDHGRAKPA